EQQVIDQVLTHEEKSTLSSFGAASCLEEKIVMAHALSLAMRLFIVVFAMGYRIVEGTMNLTTVSDQESSLGYPCNLDELQRHGFAPEWDNGCEGPHQLLFLHIPKTG
ncbi:unnamed protein product, partial [Ascophyllum nodosum]